MADALFQLLLPTFLVFLALAVLAAAAVFTVRALRRSPRARAAADDQRELAAEAILRLHAAAEELDLETAAAGSRNHPDQAATLRRARIAAQHARDAAFDEYRALIEAPASVTPPERRRLAEQIIALSDQACNEIAEARAIHAAWVIDEVDATAQVASVRSRFAAVSAELGDTGALVAELTARVDQIEWSTPAALAARTQEALAEADATIASVEAAVRDMDVAAGTDLPALLTRAEAALRRAQTAARALDESHRLARQSAAGVAEDLVSARDSVRGATQVLAAIDADGPETGAGDERGDGAGSASGKPNDPRTAEAVRLDAAIREAEASLARLEATAQRRPVTTVNELARVRVRLDLAQDALRSPRQRLRDARSALPGTLAAARNAIARAEVSLAANPDASADSRVFFAAALDALAGARSRTDPVRSLEDARHAMRDAEEASALAAGAGRFSPVATTLSTGADVEPDADAYVAAHVTA